MDTRPFSISALLKKRRLEKNLTQEELSKRLDKPQSFISKIENRERNVDLLDFIDICNALEIHAAEEIVHIISLDKETK